jgi:hypothetical protein
MVNMVIHGNFWFFPVFYPVVSITREFWLPPMHDNHGNCRLSGNLSGKHISPLEVVVQFKMDIHTVWLMRSRCAVL